MIKTRGLMKKFQSVLAVDRLDLDIPPGEIFGFLGPNGAGKTTTVKLMTGLLRPTAGRAWVAGFDVQADPRQAKKMMGLVPDQPYVYPHLTGNEFLRFIADLYEVELSTQKKKIPELLEMFELGEMGLSLIHILWDMKRHFSGDILILASENKIPGLFVQGKFSLGALRNAQGLWREGVQLIGFNSQSLVESDEVLKEWGAVFVPLSSLLGEDIKRIIKKLEFVRIFA